MSYGQCEYVWPTKIRQRCQAPATVIVAGPKPGENPQKLCSDHEALVAELTFYEEGRERDRQITENIKELFGEMKMSDREWKDAVKQNLREIREHVEAVLAWIDSQ